MSVPFSKNTKRTNTNSKSIQLPLATVLQIHISLFKASGDAKLSTGFSEDSISSAR